MAYATAEQRHEKQGKHEGSFSVENKLQQYLRDHYTPDTLNETSQLLLMQVAKDYDLKVNKQRSDEEYAKLAKDAINTFTSNFNKRKGATDDRGQRLGKAVVATLQGIRY